MPTASQSVRVLACDPCYERATGNVALCEDYCALPPDHRGLCSPGPAWGPKQCDMCSTSQHRLHWVDLDGSPPPPPPGGDVLKADLQLLVSMIPEEIQGEESSAAAERLYQFIHRNTNRGL
jgi:hypothetical protein